MLFQTQQKMPPNGGGFFQLRRVFRALMLLITSIFLLISCQQKASVASFNGKTMGTTYNITVVGSSESINASLSSAQHDQIAAAIDKKLLYINQLMSTYIPDSEISRFNQSAHGEWFTVSSDTLEVIQYSLYLSEITQGLFDITVSPLIELWGFGKSGATEFPAPSAIEAARTMVGWQYLEIDEASSRIKKIKPLTIDLSAIAKGYGVDVISDLLEELGINNYLVEIGGEIRVKGINPEQQLWRIGVETPSVFQTSAQKVIALEDVSVATSGDYRNFFEKEGIRYSHTIDPTTGRPVIHDIASITVLANTAMAADGLATAFMALGEQGALRLAEELSLPIYILRYQQDMFSESFSSDFSHYLNEKK
ncbi:FAD:protein FMN transferase [Eionea flava]